MAPDERDRNFDKALARHLRSSAASGVCRERPLALRTAVLSRSGNCLPLITTRSLLPEEMNLWKEHIVGCAHCQDVLAHLETTDRHSACHLHSN